MTATAALLTGLATSANAVPLNMQPGPAPLPDAARSAKPKATVLASRDKASTKPKESEDVAARAKGVLTVVVSKTVESVVKLVQELAVGVRSVSKAKAA